MATRKVTLLPAAEDDVVEILSFIQRDSANAGSKFLTAVEDCFSDLSRSPELGFTREFQSSRLNGIRRWRIRGFENYLVFYRVLSQHIEIVRIMHGARDIEATFDDDPE